MVPIYIFGIGNHHRVMLCSWFPSVRTLPSCKSLRRPVQWLRDSVVATSYLQCNNFVAKATECTSINFAQSRAASKFGRIQSSTSAFLPSSPPFLSLSLSLLCLRCSLSFFPSFSSHQQTNLTLNVRPRARRHAYSSRVFLTICRPATFSPMEINYIAWL